MSCSAADLLHLASSFVGTHESPEDSNLVPRLDATIGTKTARAGSWIDVRGLEWCARMASGLAWLCSGSVLPAVDWSADAYRKGSAPLPFGFRAAVSELVADAVASGAWRPREIGYVPFPGDLAVFRRGGHDPSNGGVGHVAIVESFAGPKYTTIGGNEQNEVRRTDRDLTKELDGAELVGWIASGLAQSKQGPAVVANLGAAAIVALVVGAGAGWMVVRHGLA